MTTYEIGEQDFDDAYDASLAPHFVSYHVGCDVGFRVFLVDTGYPCVQLNELLRPEERDSFDFHNHIEVRKRAIAYWSSRFPPIDGDSVGELQKRIQTAQEACRHSRQRSFEGSTCKQYVCIDCGDLVAMEDNKTLERWKPMGLGVPAKKETKANLSVSDD